MREEAGVVVSPLIPTNQASNLSLSPSAVYLLEKEEKIRWSKKRG
jgi:hypothetical protein